MKLTAKEAVEKSIELWEWLAETGEDKYEWDEWERNGGKYSNDIDGDCFLCEYVGQQSSANCHSACPYYAKYGDTCCKEGFPFEEWEAAESNRNRKKYAKLFLEQLKTILKEME